jgi:hypothetical protein
MPQIDRKSDGTVAAPNNPSQPLIPLTDFDTGSTSLSVDEEVPQATQQPTSRSTRAPPSADPEAQLIIRETDRSASHFEMLRARNEAEKATRALVVIAAFTIVLFILALQGVGLNYAISGIKFRDLKVSWCSPVLETFVVAVADGNTRDQTTNCPSFYDVTIDSNKGIGCVRLLARRQMDWLLNSIVIISLSLACEGLDIIVLCFASPPMDLTETSDNEDKKGILGKRDLRRPWTTVRFLSSNLKPELLSPCCFV